MDTLQLTDIARNVTQFPSILATRFTGKQFWTVFRGYLDKFSTDEVVYLSFSGVDVMDASFSDEVFSQLAVLRARKEYKFCYLILTELNETCEENLDMALVTRIDREPDDKPNLRNCALLYKKNDELNIIGKFENHVFETFTALMKEKTLSARDISDILDISLNAGSTRLKTLSDLGFAKRTEIRDEQGKQYLYHALD